MRLETVTPPPQVELTMKSIIVASLVAGALGGAVELHSDNYQSEVFGSGKNAFVKFLAPWCVQRSMPGLEGQPGGDRFDISG